MKHRLQRILLALAALSSPLFVSAQGTESQLAVWIEVLEVEAADQQSLIEGVARATEVLAQQPGFQAVGVYRSVEEARVVTYLNWQDRASLKAAHSRDVYKAAVAAYEPLVAARHADTFEAVSTLGRPDAQGVTLCASCQGAFIIDLIPTEPDEQAAHLSATVANGERFAQNPASQALTVLRGESGASLVTFAWWDSTRDFFAAFEAASGMPVDSMAALNETTARMSGGKSATDYWQYEVVTVTPRE